MPLVLQKFSKLSMTLQQLYQLLFAVEKATEQISITISSFSIHRPESNEPVRDQLRLEIKKHKEGIVFQRGNRRR